MNNHPQGTTQFAQIAGIAQHSGDYTGAPGELSINNVNHQLLFHDGCTCNGVAYVQMELTDCAKENAEASEKAKGG